MRRKDYYGPQDGWDITVIRRLTEDRRDSDLHRSNPPRTKHEWPYAYDPFTVWGAQGQGANDSVYTDRLYQWDYEKTDRIGKEIFGTGVMGWFGQNMDPERVQTFLRRWHDDDTIILTRVVEFCNASNGYPTWLLVYRTTKTA